jgi:hypothetical protein
MIMLVRVYQEARLWFALLEEVGLILKKTLSLEMLLCMGQRVEKSTLKLLAAEKVMHLMEESGLPPNIIAFNSLITGYGKVGLLKQAMGYSKTSKM